MDSEQSGNFRKIESAVEAAFRQHRQQVGDHWSWQWAIVEADAVDFVTDILNELHPPCSTSRKSQN
jgi:hypothetical protein